MKNNLRTALASLLESHMDMRRLTRSTAGRFVRAEEDARAALTPEETDRVILRRFRAKPHEVIALLPDREVNKGMVLSYMHLGQHGEADRRGIFDITYACKPDDSDARAMLAELRSIGYNPRVVKRIAKRGTNK